MVSLNSLGQEFEALMDEVDFYFDRETEKVVFVDTYNYSLDDDDEDEFDGDDEDDDEESVDEEYLYNQTLNQQIKTEPGRFVQLPSKYEINEWQIMSDFVDDRPDGERKEILQDSIHGKGAFRIFRNMIERFDLLEDWYRFKAAAYREKAREWCEENDIEYTE
jgi:hypothetical protein